MRPRTELGLAAGLLLGLGVLAVALGSRRARAAPNESPRSTYLTTPGGASAFAEAAARLGVEVDRFRRPTAALAAPDSARRGSVIALLGPSTPLTAGEAGHLLGLPVDLLLAGPGSAAATRCLGYQVSPRKWTDPAATRPPENAEHLPSPRVWAVLTPHPARSIVDSSGQQGRKVRCEVPEPVRVDTLLLTVRDRLVAVRLWYPGDRAVTLVADDRLFRNRTLRNTSAGTLMLGLVAPRYRRLVVDEYHHGYQAAGSITAAALDWSARSPWGWVVWQLAAVGLVALLASGVRFGPVRAAIERRRRSPIEHVRALATALAAARGHDVAVRLMIQGLRRRLSRGGRPAPADLDTWLEGLRPSVRTARGREALDSLTATTRRPPDADSVLVAANAVETLWEELKPT
ncbi:MAG TPA: DUF4350 domain-containing protein [Gemmatimonadales bacterium]|jgi:hypothetical protein|nr:DUF4350 domain-containing protein [Gemmatimonadales bacterium]